jgi:uncharacterized protein (TIGR03437 family)
MKILPTRRLVHLVLCAGLFAGALLVWPLTSHLAKVRPRVQPFQQLAKSHFGQEAAGNPADTIPTGTFVIVQTPQGRVCRAISASEPQAQVAVERAPVHLLEQPRPQLQQQQGLDIVLRGTQQLENNPQAKAAFLRAAAKWEAIIRTPIKVILDVDFGPTLFGEPYEENVIGSTFPQILGSSSASAYRDVRTALLNTASGNAAQTAIYNALPSTALPTELGNAAAALASSANLRALGFLAPEADPVAESDFGDPPSIGFNSAFTYDFDPSDGIAPNAQDFEAAAVHEIGHALGFFSLMGFKETSPTFPVPFTPWDLFRFRPGGLVFDSLGNRPRVQMAGGSQVFFVGGEEYALSTATNAGTNGDTNQGDHWKADEQTGQYIGIMDPTGAPGERSDISSADLVALASFGYQLTANTTVFEALAVSDASSEESQNRSNALVVNRYTPPRYPAKLEFFRVRIPAALDGSVQTGQTLRIFGFADAQRTGQPPANPALLFDRTVTLTQLPPRRYLEVQIPNGPSLNSGDLYVGVQAASGTTLPISVDLSGRQQGRSFISTNNGQSFQPLASVNQPTPVAANFMALAIMSMSFANTPSPGALTLSPAAVPPGNPALTLFVSGSNFQPNSVVRVNNSDRQTSFQSGSLLQAQIPASDLANAGTLKVTVVTPGPGGGESVPADLIVSANHPAPAITRLDPVGTSTGGSSLTLNVFGTNFNAQSRIRIGGNERPTTLVSSIQLSTVLTQAELASPANLAVTVVNAAPGGGTSNAQNFAVVSCTFTTSLANVGSRDVVSANGATATTALNRGFVLNPSSSVCSWNATVNEPWVTLTGVTSGVGRTVINYRVQAQPASATSPREARLTAGNQDITILQVGRAAAASAASFTAQFAPNTINALFGAGLAKETVSAMSTPLPTTLSTTQVLVADALGAVRAAPFFFVSPGQLNLLLPDGTATGGANMMIYVDGQPYAESRVTVNAVAPGLFTANANGSGVPAAVLLRIKADGSQSFEPVAELNPTTNRYVPRPIDFVNETDRLILLLFGTGFRGRSNLEAVVLRFGDLTVPVQFAGAQGDLVGLDQLNVELPRTLRGRGEVNLTGTVDGRTVNAVTLAFK